MGQPVVNIDLDAARAARREANGEAPTITFDGKTFTLPVELPFEVAAQIAAMQKDEDASGIRGAVEAFLGSDAASDFFESRPSVADVNALVEGLVKAYGFEDVGESQASAASS